MDAATYAGAPAARALRAARVRVAVPGSRTKVPEVVTTPLDARAYPARDLAALYRARWPAELDLRALRIAPGMDVSRCETPARARNEVWAHLPAYNLIRAPMAAAAGECGCTPRDPSSPPASRGHGGRRAKDSMRGRSARPAPVRSTTAPAGSSRGPASAGASNTRGSRSHGAGPKSGWESYVRDSGSAIHAVPLFRQAHLAG
jgi:hypothetical protein